MNLVPAPLCNKILIMNAGTVFDEIMSQEARIRAAARATQFVMSRYRAQPLPSGQGDNQPRNRKFPIFLNLPTEIQYKIWETYCDIQPGFHHCFTKLGHERLLYSFDGETRLYINREGAPSDDHSDELPGLMPGPLGVKIQLDHDILIKNELAPPYSATNLVGVRPGSLGDGDGIDDGDEGGLGTNRRVSRPVIWVNFEHDIFQFDRVFFENLRPSAQDIVTGAIRSAAPPREFFSYLYQDAAPDISSNSGAETEDDAHPKRPELPSSHWIFQVRKLALRVMSRETNMPEADKDLLVRLNKLRVVFLIAHIMPCTGQVDNPGRGNEMVKGLVPRTEVERIMPWKKMSKTHHIFHLKADLEAKFSSCHRKVDVVVVDDFY